MADDRRGPSIFEELKRRKVVRVAVVYGATVFAVLQLADLLVDPLGLPGWTMRFLVVAGAAFFPVALVLAWAFEVTPEGVARTPSVAEVESGGTGGSVSTPSILSRRTVASVGVLLLVGFGAGWFFAPAGSVAPGAEGVDSGGADGVGPVEVRPNGIAVLPFTSRSAGEGSADFFAAGLHDDLLTRLAGVDELVVISRTSVEQYRETTKSVPEIGRELSVAFVLEGGVQQSGDRLRVNAQLIDARSDEHLWAETFDGDLAMADVFAIQEGLAERIVEAMEGAISLELGAVSDEAPATESVEAWRALTRARELRALNDLDGAAESLRRAVEADPDFGEAWAALSETESLRYWFGSETGDEALDALNRALILAPDAPTTDWAKATYQYYVQLAYRDGLATIERAVERAPGRAEFHSTRGNLLRRIGDWSGAADAYERAIELDPRNPNFISVLIETLYPLGRSSEAERWIEELLRLPTVDPYSAGLAVHMRALHGDVAGARRILERLDPELRRSPEIEKTMWHIRMLTAGERPDILELRRMLEAQAWGARGSMLALWEYASMLVPPWADGEHAAFVLAGLERRLAMEVGPQAEILDRGLRAYALARLGREAEALREAEGVLAWVRRTGDRNVGGPLLYDVALTLDVLGDREGAVALIGEALEHKNFAEELLPLDPAAADLAADPRIRALLGK